jgi:tRNA threonylcarbamoyladenosine biosynthesis protein TsaB
MRVLALDTTTRAGSVAIVDEDRVLVEAEGDARRSHAERLPGDLFRALEASGLSIADIDLFAIASGPGSFTGLRIGISTMQGLATVRRRRLATVSALSALAEAAAAVCGGSGIVGVWIDAHRRDVFSALYRVVEGPPPFAIDHLIELDPPDVGRPEAALDRWRTMDALPAVVAGDGAVAYGDVLASQTRVVLPPPLAGIVGRMAIGRARAGQDVVPAGVQPLYVRRPDAEVAREKLAR